MHSRRTHGLREQLSVLAIGYLLQRHIGESNRATRPAALIAVATELPPPVLADLLGLTVQIAQRWAARREARTAGSAAKEGRITHMRNIYLPPVRKETADAI